MKTIGKEQLEILGFRLVYIEWGSEENEGGAGVCDAVTDETIGITTDRKLINASIDTTDSDAQGIVAATTDGEGVYFALHHKLTREEIREFGI